MMRRTKMHAELNSTPCYMQSLADDAPDSKDIPRKEPIHLGHLMEESAPAQGSKKLSTTIIMRTPLTLDTSEIIEALFII